jgi:NAD(P)-dependent dehydrogenase (short-subunit alcohol dehydrogenase family)
MSFTGKKVLVTGSSRGIGLATAQRFLEQGASVVINGRSDDSVAAALKSLGSQERVHGVAADMSRVEDCSRLVEQAVATLGGLDILVTAAGVAYPMPVEETNEELWDATLDINLKGLFFTCRAALTALRESRGCVVNVASDSGVRGEAFLVAYCASKAAVINLTKAMALELAPDVRVNCICPGYVDTDMVRRDFIEQSEDPAEIEAMLKHTTPLNRFAAPEEIANAICYLSGPDSTFMTGTSLSIDGGTTAGTFVSLEA